MADINAQSGYIRGMPDLSWWNRQIRLGIEYRKKSTHETQWDTWRGYYKGNFKSDVLPVNLFFRMMRTVVPRIYFRNPSISVIPSKPGPEHQAFAQLIERLDNKLMRTMQMKQTIKRMVQHCWLTGSMIGKLGMGSTFAPSPDPSGGETVEIYGKGSGGKERVEYDSRVVDNMPWFAACHPGRFILPAGLEMFEEARWSAMWIQRPLWDVLQDPRLKNTRGLGGSSNIDLGEMRRVKPGDTPDHIDLIEVRDKKFGRVFVYAPYHTDRVLYDESDGMQMNGRMGYYHKSFNENDDCVWGVPDAKILEPQQLELNEVRTLQMKHRRLALIKILYETNGIDKEELEKFLDGEVGAGVQVKDINKIKPMQVADIPKDLFMFDQAIMNDVREGMGFSRNQFGNYAEGSADRTAFEARVVQEAVEIRIDERRDMIADMLVDVFEDVHSLVFDRWTSEQVVQVIGPYGIPIWVSFKPVAMKGAEYEVQIEPDSTLPETKAIRQQKAMQVYTMMKDNPLIDPYLITKYMLHEMHGVQFDNLIKAVIERAASGMPGATPDTAMDVPGYIQALANPASANIQALPGPSQSSNNKQMP